MKRMKKIPLTYTLCFLTRGEEVLMLHRNRPPNLGKWNGVGGRIEPGESPRMACLREVREETGYQLPNARFAGLLTWHGFEAPEGGLYLFTAPAPDEDPVAYEEGQLQWQPRAFTFTSDAVVDNLHYVLPAILDGTPPAVFHFDYRDGKMTAHAVYALPEWLGADLIEPQR
jgi:8-oxo-dGTP diphosphatase